MTEQPSEQDIHSYVDGLLDPGSRFAMERHLSGDPALAAHVMRELSTRTALRLLAGEPARAPAAMKRLAMQLQERAHGRFWRRAVPVSGGLAMAAALAAFLVLPHAPPSYVDMAVASHKVAMLRARMNSQIETPAIDYREIQVRTHIDLPALPADWQVTDVQLFPTRGAPALIVAVRTTDGRQFSLFATREKSSAPNIPDAIREGVQSVAYWRRGAMSYALTGEDEPGSVDAVAEHLNRFWS